MGSKDTHYIQSMVIFHSHLQALKISRVTTASSRLEQLDNETFCKQTHKVLIVFSF